MTINVQEINSNYCIYRNLKESQNNKPGIAKKAIQSVTNPKFDSVSFKGLSGTAGNGLWSKACKTFWLLFRKLSEYMKKPSEMINALVAFVGTAIIAPIAILFSPSKKTDNPEAQKKEKDRKLFQALRQPVSAFLAFGFQVPTTLGIAKLLNTLAYEKHLKLFDDEVLGTLIPDKGYLSKEANNVLNGKASQKVKDSWKQELEEINKDADALQKEYIKKLKETYTEVGLEISDEEIEAALKNTKKKNKFLSEKMADAKQKQLLAQKVEELKDKNIKFKDVDMVTEDYQDLAKLRYKKDFDTLRADAKLSLFDKFIDLMGIKNKKLQALEDAEKKLAKEKGLDLMQKDMPEVLSDAKQKLKYFIENRNVKAQKIYANKIYWLTLVTNLFMVAGSCIALNWLHPKFANLMDSLFGKNNEQKKVEVRA